MRGELQAAIEHRIMTGTTFMGVPALKNPMDAWVYQEIIYELRPDVIVEVGNHKGGALLYLANLCDLLGHGEVIGIDKREHLYVCAEVFVHERIELVRGDAIAVFQKVADIVDGRSCLVIEDSSHAYDHTLAVLRTYSTLIQPGGYLICEDGLMPDVAKALRTFTGERKDFEADRSREWPVTWNPGGYLRRVE